MNLLVRRFYYEAPRVTNTTVGQNVNQVLFRVRKSIELLSNQVLDPFSLRIDREIKEFAWGLRSTIEGERESSCSILGVLK